MDEKMKRKLSDDDLDQVSGGEIFNAVNISGHDLNNPWEVLNEKGEVIGRAPTRDDAIWLAGNKGVSSREVKTWEEVEQMRRQK